MQILTTSAIETYINSLDLTNNKDKALIFAGLNTLNIELYITVVSALAAGAITFTDIKTLPAISDFTINLLLKSKLDLNSIGYLQYSYQTSIIPGLPMYSSIKSKYNGTYKNYVSKIVSDVSKWFVDVKYIYDTGTVGFLNFEDAQTFYFNTMKSSQITQLFTEFKTFFDAKKVGVTGLTAAKYEESFIGKVLESTKTELVFFPTSTVLSFNTTYASTIRWLLQGLYTNILLETFDASLKEVSLLAAQNRAEDLTKYNGNGRIILNKMTVDWTKHKEMNETLYDNLTFKGLFLYELYGVSASSSVKQYEFYYTLAEKAQDILNRMSAILTAEFKKQY